MTKGGGIAMGMFNLDSSIEGFASGADSSRRRSRACNTRSTVSTVGFAPGRSSRATAACVVPSLRASSAWVSPAVRRDSRMRAAALMPRI